MKLEEREERKEMGGYRKIKRENGMKKALYTSRVTDKKWG